MAPRVGVIRRDAHETMHAALAFQPAIGVLALDQHRRRLDAGGVAARDRRSLRPCMSCALAQRDIHAPQHRRPVLALRAAGAGVDLDIAVVARRLRRRTAPSARPPWPCAHRRADAAPRLRPARPCRLRPPPCPSSSTASLASRSRSRMSFIPHLELVVARASASGLFAGSFQKSGRSESAFSSARRFSATTPVKDASCSKADGLPDRLDHVFEFGRHRSALDRLE